MAERFLRPSSYLETYSEDGDELLLPQSIYAQLQYLETTYGYVDGEEDSYDETSDEEGALDLSAPPPESWYHGKISRQTSYQRLQEVGEPGAYLVRDSTNQPGDYAISYLSKMGQIHHFKINSICGDYYIGGRQFSSLVDLIGYYTNCSHILENEGLEVPVVPPAPVPLHTLYIAVAPHRKDPGTDELNITPGEVFVLLTLLNEDWGWGRSQRTGDSGLIPLTVMEEVIDADTNLGKPWFHCQTGREEAIELLMQKGGPGDFLFRAGQQQGMYSLSVRAFDSVQRFLIQKHYSGYYVFGGRWFVSLDAIIERYKKEVILDSLKLESPLPPEVALTSSRTAARKRTGSMAIPRGGFDDKTGVLQLRRGKKSPVYGKWKEFYFHLKYKEQKLLYYDNEKSHRPRGLLDLKECRMHFVHPSLYGRDDCFVIMLQYLNELFYHYICAGSAETAQEWLRMMRQCVNKKPKVPRSEVQQIRSLSLQVKECRLNKATHSQVFCRIAFDSCFVARTRPLSDEHPCIFDENYRFEDLQANSSVVTVDVTAMRKGPFYAKDASLGGVKLNLASLPNGQDFDQWHTLTIPNTKGSRGSLRLVATFKHEVILPLEEYRGLAEIILNDDLIIIETLSKECNEHHSELSGTLIEIFCHYQRVLPILSECLARAIEKEDNVATLFRASTVATMLMDQFMKLMAMDYLLLILRQPVQSITNSVESCELNPGYLPRGSDAAKNQEILESHISLVLNGIYGSVDSCPPPLKYLFHCLQELVSKKWPADNSVQTRAVSAFLFLRFICPAILKPHLFNLVSEPPSNNSDRSLKLVTKTVQNVANLVEFKTKEPFMAALNAFINKHTEKMKKFVDEISNVKEIPRVNHSSNDPARAWASLYHLCQTYEHKLKKVSEKQKEVVELLSVMQILKATEERYLSSGIVQ